MAEGGTELIAIQTKQRDQSHEMAKQLQESLQNIREGEVGALVNAVYDMRDQLVSHRTAFHRNRLLNKVLASLN